MLLLEPRGHKLQVATFADGVGILVICSQCGHFAASNKKGPLHKEACRAKGGQQSFQSPGAKAAYERVCMGKHPKHAKGEAKVLDPCMSAETFLRLADTEASQASSST